tara:strand:- start:889 stop:1983 length:1095 start_codon:yes stop_codon:yes gene_type:complete
MNINPNEYFLANDNLEMLWELLTEETSFKNKSPKNRQNIYDVFCNNLVSFNDTEKQKGADLMNMNKKYVMSMINYINNLDSKELQNNTLINSLNKSSSSNLGGSNSEGILKKNSQKYTPVTAEDIQNNRKILFEQELVKHQKDFDDVIKKHIPEELNFKIDLDDGPIKEMDKKIKEITAQRNYELQQINNSYDNNNVAKNIPNTNTNLNAANLNAKTNANTNPLPTTNDGKVYIQIDNKDINMKNEDINIINLDQISDNQVENTNITNMNTKTNTNTTTNTTTPNIDISGLFNKLKKVDNSSSNTTTPNTEEWNNINSKIDTMRNDITSINDKIELLYNMITKIATKDTQENTATDTATDKDIP